MSMTRYEVRQANHQSSRAGWITCEYCGAPARTIWYVDRIGDETACFCSVEHIRNDRISAQGPTERGYGPPA